MSLRKTFYETTYTPIPSHIPRQLAIDLLHNHSEIIELNPLVIGHRAISPPPKAPAEEYYSTWYEINQRIQFIPGTGKVGSGKINFNGVFHDLPTGVQTHVYAAAGVDIRHNYSIGGNQPGETPEAKDLGSGAPASGLYLKQDVTIACNVMMISFVKKEMKAATEVLLARLIKKAELIDAGVLHAMMEDGKLKTINPAIRSSTTPAPSSSLSSRFPSSNRSSTIPYPSPRLPNEGGFAASPQDMQSNIRQSSYGQSPSAQGLGFELPADSTHSVNSWQSQYGQSPSGHGMGFELPADNTYPVQSPTSSFPSDSQPSTDPTSYYEMSGESATPHHEPPAEQKVSVEQEAPIEKKIPKLESNDRVSHHFDGSECIAQDARRASWTPDDDKI